MTVGTRSLLIGAHCFFLHPFFVAWAWWKLYGFPFDPRLWCAFFLHDIGYFGKPNIDGPEGKTHPRLGAMIMSLLFDYGGSTRWWDFTLFHSRSTAKSFGREPSALCLADKYAMALEPRWLYLFRVRLTGEIVEYTTHYLLNTKRPTTPVPLQMLTVPQLQAVWYDYVHHDSLTIVARSGD